MTGTFLNIKNSLNIHARRVFMTITVTLFIICVITPEINLGTLRLNFKMKQLIEVSGFSICAIV